ncbi:MAG: ADOP family duplicated permease [Terriglobales bacterium]
MFSRRRKERELEEELAFHLEQAEAKYGSRQKAVALLGGEEATKEGCREERRGAWLASVGRDLRLGARILRKSPGYTAVAVITLALCIGVTTAVFSILDAALLQTPPFPQPERIVAVVSVLGGEPAPGNPLWAGDFADLRAGAPAIAELAAYDEQSYNLSGAGEAVHVSAMAVTPNFFQVLGVAPARGRAFAAGEAHSVVLSDKLWRKQFGGAPMLGRIVRLDGTPYTVVGTMPPKFAQGGSSDFDTQVWVPMAIPPAGWEHEGATAFTLYTVGRLRPRATLAEAKAQVAAVAMRERKHPAEHDFGAAAMTLHQRNTENRKPSVLAMFMTLAVFILLIGCANVAGLGLGRAAARADEMAIRRALGAWRGRLVRQVLTETAELAGLAAALGLLLGWLGLRVMNAAVNVAVLHMDGRVLAATAAAALATVLAAGLPPALRLGARATGGAVVRGGSGGRRALVAIEVGLTAACLVVIGAVVLSIAQNLRLPLGYQPQHVLAGEVALRGPDYQTAVEQAALSARLQVVAAALPGATAAALISPPPLDWNEERVAVRGRAPLDWSRLKAPKVYYASPGYFRLLQVPLLRGRTFTAADAASAPQVAVISRAVARRLFAIGVSPIGQSIHLDRKGEPWRRIVGVCGDVAIFYEDGSTNGEIYEPLAQAQPLQMTLGVLVRASGEPDAMIAPLRGALAGVDPTLALYNAGALKSKLANAAAVSDAAFMHLLELLAGLSLLLSAIGLYSVVAYAATARRREIGIRTALGATSRQLQRMLLLDTVGITVGGLVAGLAVGWAGLRVLASGTGSLGEPMWLLLALPAGLLGVIAALALWLPARRAARADPLAALRVE